MKNKQTTRQMHLIVTSIFFTALILRITAVYLFGHPNVIGYTESGVIAKNVFEGKGFTYDLYGSRSENPFTSFVPPLFPGLILLILQSFQNVSLALELSHALLGSITAVFIYFIALTLSQDKRVAFLAGFGVALYPAFIIMAAFPQSVILNTFVLTAAILAILHTRTRLPWTAALTGFLIGISVLARPNLILLLPLSLLYLWFVGGRKQLVKASAILILFTLLTLLTLLPWTIRNYQVHKQFVFISTNGGFNLWNGNNPFTAGSGHEVYSAALADYRGQPHDPSQPEVIELRPYPLPADLEAQITTINEVDLDKALYRASLDFIRQNPEQWPALLGVKLKSFWWFRVNIGARYEADWTRYYKLGYGFLLPIVLVGLLMSLQKWRNYSLLYMLFVLYTLVYTIYQVQMRFRWEIEPFFLIFAALPISYGWQWLWSKRKRGESV